MKFLFSSFLVPNFTQKSWNHRVRKHSADEAMVPVGCSLVHWAQVWKFVILFLHIKKARTSISVLVHSADRTFSVFLAMTVIHDVQTFSCWFALSFRYHPNTPTGSLRGSEHCFPASVVPMPNTLCTTCSLSIDDVIRYCSSFFPTAPFTETARLVGWLPQTGYKEQPPLCHSQKWAVRLVDWCLLSQSGNNKQPTEQHNNCFFNTSTW